MPELTLRAARIGDYDFALALYLESMKPLLMALGRWDEERILSRFADGFKLEQIQSAPRGPEAISAGCRSPRRKRKCTSISFISLKAPATRKSERI